MRLTDEMKEIVERLRLCYVATVTPDGKPNLSPKGSLKVWDDETVVFAEIRLNAERKGEAAQNGVAACPVCRNSRN